MRNNTSVIEVKMTGTYGLARLECGRLKFFD